MTDKVGCYALNALFTWKIKKQKIIELNRSNHLTFFYNQGSMTWGNGQLIKIPPPNKQKSGVSFMIY